MSEESTKKPAADEMKSAEAKPSQEKPQKKFRKRGWKILAIVLAVLALLLVIFLAIAALMFDKSIKHGIQIIGSKVTQCNITVGHVKTSLIHGKITIDNLVISNPEGFKTDSILNVGSIHVDVDMSTLLKDKIVVTEVIITDPVCTYELKGIATSNVSVIQENVNAALPQKSEEEALAEAKRLEAEREMAKAEAEARGETYVEPKGKSVQLDLVRISGGKIRLSHTVFSGSAMSIPLPTITLKDIGKEDKVSMTEAVAEVINELFNSILTAAKNLGAGIGEGAKKGYQKVEEAVKGFISGRNNQ